jgi:LCP family protein required for cell wall assembly
MTERQGGSPEDAPLPPHLDPRRGRPARDGGPSYVGRRAAAPGEDRPLPPHLDPRRGTARPAPGPRHPRRRGRLLRRGLSLLLVLLLVGLVGGLAALAYYDRRIDRVPVAAVRDEGVDPDGRDRNVLLVGSDSREGLTEEELREVRTGLKGGGNEGTLTDTVVLLHVPAGGGTPVLVSFPRDSWVEIPGADRGRINTAYQVGEREGEGGGPSKLVETVENVSGLQVDAYMEVGFIAFLRLTDALGGVEVNLCQPAQDVKAGIDLPAGPQRLDGGDALGFVRQREGLPRGDLDRVARQQYFLAQAARQVLSPGTLLRPDRALRLLQAVTSSVTVDEDTSTFDLARLAWRLRGAASGGLAYQTVPVSDPAARRGSAVVVELDEAALPGFFTGLSPGDGKSVEPPPTVEVAPSAIRLEVRNGTTRAGLARTAAEDLERQGFTVTGAGNADRTDAATSVVLHGSERAESAATVAAAVPGARTQLDPSQGARGLVLVVGQDYRGTRAVTVGPAEPAPAPPAEGPAGEPAAPAAPAGPPCVL